MKAYIDKLKAKTAEAEHLREQAKAKSHIVDMRMSPEWAPLTEQIETLMRNLPPAQRERPWAMEELCLRLKGSLIATNTPCMLERHYVPSAGYKCVTGLMQAEDAGFGLNVSDVLIT